MEHSVNHHGTCVQSQYLIMPGLLYMEGKIKHSCLYTAKRLLWQTGLCSTKKTPSLQATTANGAIQ